ncbi:MAG: nucleotidyltransferase domain-containing protein [Campylobacterales bacterium]|nr:nucleotidyltransferase domain-containing protein [Campylobacterales bacterium]
MTTKEKVLNTLKELKPKYEKEGFIIKGLFGSIARGEETQNSDVDILYDINREKFSKKYSGFVAFSRLADIKEELESKFQKNVDICSKNGLSKTGEKYILKETIYV